MCSSLMKCVSPTRERISLGICVSRVEKHMSLGINTYHAETHITRDKCSVEHISLWRQMWREMCFPYTGTHIIRNMGSGSLYTDVVFFFFSFFSSALTTNPLRWQFIFYHARSMDFEEKIEGLSRLVFWGIHITVTSQWYVFPRAMCFPEHISLVVVIKFFQCTFLAKFSYS